MCKLETGLQVGLHMYASVQYFGIEADAGSGYVANDTDALVAMLAATSLGCIWSGIRYIFSLHSDSLTWNTLS